MVLSLPNVISGVKLVYQDPLYYGVSTVTYEGTFRGERVAIRRYRMYYMRGEIDKLQKEVKIMTRVKGPHVLHFHGVNNELFPDPVMVLPWMERGTISQYRKAKGPANINIERRMTEITLALDYIHSSDIIHGAISTSTVFIKLDGSACLGGFGLAETIDSAGGFADDIYSFASLLCKLYTGHVPFCYSGREIFRVAQNLGIPQRPLQYEDTGVAIPDDIWYMLFKCLDYDRAERFSSRDVRRFVEKLNLEWKVDNWTMIETTVAHWLFDKYAPSLLWVENTSAGSTTYISRCMAELCAREGRLASSLWFIRESGLTWVGLFTSFVMQFVTAFPVIEHIVRQILKDCPSILEPENSEQLRDMLGRLFIDPLSSIGSSNISAKVIILDSLDEWDRCFQDVWSESLLWLSTILLKRNLPLRVFVASSAEIHRRAKRNNATFSAFSVFLCPRGIIDSSMGAWEALQRICCMGAGIGLNHLQDDKTTYDIPVNVVRKVEEWCKDSSKFDPCWVEYPSLMYGWQFSVVKCISGMCYRRQALVACIFSSSNSVNPSSLIPTLAFQLGNSIPWLKPNMEKVLENRREILTTESIDFSRAVILEPLLAGEYHQMSPQVIIIDSLKDDLVLQQIIWLAFNFKDRQIPIRFLLTSDPVFFSHVNFTYPNFMDDILVLHCPEFDTWTSSKFLLAAGNDFNVESTQLQKVFSYGDLHIYKNPVKVLTRRISMHYEGDNILREELQSYLDFIRNLSKVDSLINSDRCRTWLMKISSLTGISDQADLKLALADDEKMLAEFVGELLSIDTVKTQILSLRDEEALSVLDLLQAFLVNGTLRDKQMIRKARRVFIKLSQNSDIILPSQMINGLTLLNNGEPVNGGGYADIFRAEYEGKPVALKRIRLYLGKDSRKIRRAFASEALVWQLLKHPNILTFLGIDSEMFATSFCMVSPWMKHGTILDFFATMGISNISIEERLAEIAQGLRYLHAEGVIHGDLRGGNILIDDDWHAVLADFGLTAFGDSTISTTHDTNPRGTIRWMAPELLDPEVDDISALKKTVASDVYAFGCVCLELYTGLNPFSDATNETVVMAKLVRGQRPSLDDFRDHGRVPVPEHIISLVDRCWCRNPATRPNLQESLHIILQNNPVLNLV